MKVFVAGATGVLGVRIIPLLVLASHDVIGMTRSQNKADRVRQLGADPMVCDVFDAPGLVRSVAAAAPDVVLDELTDLPDEVSEIPRFRERNDRMRTLGTRNLLQAAGEARLISESIAWRHADERARRAVEEHERLVLSAGGVVLRYGQLYGPGTYYPEHPPPPPRIHVEDAARRTVDALGDPPGIQELAEDA